MTDNRATYLDLVAAIARLTEERDEARAEAARLREAADQAITDLQAVVNMNDDPHVDAMVRRVANSLFAALEEPAS